EDASDAQKEARAAARNQMSVLFMGALARGFNQAELKEAIKLLLSVTSCLDQKPHGKCDMNLTFNGRLLDMLKVAIMAIRVNYADFLAAFLSGLSEDETTK